MKIEFKQAIKMVLQGVMLAVVAASLTGCLDMSFPPTPDFTTYKCPSGYYLLHANVKCPEGETCLTEDDNVCRKLPAVDSQGGNGPNCNAGYVTARGSECTLDMLEDEDSGCVEGKISGFCRAIPLDAIEDALTPILQGQRCTLEQRLAPKDSLRIHMIDVGQGDAIWIQTPDGKNILVDAGDAGFYNKTDASPILRDYLIFNGLAEGTEFDAYILTHPHTDHFGGFLGILNSFPPRNFVDPGAAGAASYNTLLAQLRAKDVFMYRPAEDFWKPGDDMPEEIFGTLAKATYVFSDKSPHGNDSNNASIVFRLSYAGNSMLFTGDATAHVEGKMVENSPNLIISEFYKVCHHGSTTSSSISFLESMWESIPYEERGAFISSGRVAYSGTMIPSASIVERLKGFVPVQNLLSTAAGDDIKTEAEAIRDDNILIVFRSDGQKYACYSGTN